MGGGRRELSRRVLRDLPLLGAEHHPERGREAGVVRLLAQRARRAGGLPRHRGEDHGVRPAAPGRRPVQGHRRLRSLQRAARGRLRLRADQPRLGEGRAVAVLREVPGPHGRGRLAGQARLCGAEPLLERQPRFPEAGGRPAGRRHARTALRVQHPLLRPEGHLRRLHVGQGGRRPVRGRLPHRPRPGCRRADRRRGQRVRAPAGRQRLRQGADRPQGDVPGPRLTPERGRLVVRPGRLGVRALRLAVAVGHLQRPSPRADERQPRQGAHRR